MANYLYKCYTCESVVEISHLMTESPTILCSNCETDVIMTRVLFPPMIIEEPKTIGGLSDRNASRMSDDAKKFLENKEKQKKDTPLPQGMKRKKKPNQLQKSPHRTLSNKEVSKLTQKQKENYIKTGKKE